MAKSLPFQTAAKLSKAFRKRKLSPVEVAKACLGQISAHEPALNAMSLVDEKTTLAMAAESEKRWKRDEALSSLDGVPTLIKDLLLVKGWPTRRGSRTVDPAQAWEQDAPSVARLREAGTVFMGMTTTPEFGWKGVTDSPLTGITRNPWKPDRTPGGSSGGSAAALAAGYGALAIGTDGGGSIRIPASFSGVFGHKPSFGRVAAFPPSAFGTLAHVGPMTRSVEDAALMLNIMAQPDSRDWFALPEDDTDYTRNLGKGVKGLRVAYCSTLFETAVAPDVAKAARHAVDILGELGAEVSQTNPGFADPAPTFRTLWWAGVRGALAGLPAEKKALLEPALADVLAQSAEITVEELLKAHLDRARLGALMKQFMENYDVLVMPTLPITAFAAGQLQPGDANALGKWVNWTPFSYPFNLTQQPAASLNCGFDAEGLPIGLHVIGRMFDDRTVLRVCARLEDALDLGDRLPPGMG